MIRIHFHTLAAPHRINVRLVLRAGTRCAHVYSTDSLPELLAWGRAIGLGPSDLDRSGPLPHFDCWGRNLAHCQASPDQHVVDRRTIAADIALWRARAASPSPVESPRAETPETAPAC